MGSSRTAGAVRPLTPSLVAVKMEVGIGADDGGAVRNSLLDRVSVGHVGKDGGFGVLEALEALREHIIDRLARLDDARV